MGKESDSMKSQLISEICSLSKRSVSCVHHKHPCKSSKSHFIDWYHVLGVQENADIDFIRKRYHKLALQLHPDKNKHPKADIAFKLVLEAYSCLSDNIKRQSFNSERKKSFCNECNRVPYIRCNSLNSSTYSTRLQEQSPPNRWRPSQILRGLRDIRARFREEAKVMENCLKANATLRNETPSEKTYQSNNRCRSRRESPIFDPSDYLFGGYPHVRNRIYKKPEEVLYSQRRSSSSYEQATARNVSPVFENRSRSVRQMFRTKSAFYFINQN